MPIYADARTPVGDKNRMTLDCKSKPVPISQRRAIGNLLRLADACIRDSQLLLRGGRVCNIAMLVGLATRRMVEAAVISKRGRMIPFADAGPESLDDENPVKADLAALVAQIDQDPSLLPDGKLRKGFDEAALQACIDHAAAVLTDITAHFDVDLAGQGPAGNAKPMRDEAVAPVLSASTPAGRRPSKEKVRSEPGPPVLRQQYRPVPDLEVPSRLPVSAQVAHAPATLPHRPSSNVSSVSFWSLMDRWNVPDLDALALLGHAGGLTRKGTRPRFKLADPETDMLIHLQDIDAALRSAGLDPRKWLWNAVAEAPLLGVTPIAFLTQNRLSGVHDLGHYIFRQGLRLSLGTS